MVFGSLLSAVFGFGEATTLNITGNCLRCHRLRIKVNGFARDQIVLLSKADDAVVDGIDPSIVICAIVFEVDITDFFAAWILLWHGRARKCSFTVGCCWHLIQSIMCCRECPVLIDRYVGSPWSGVN
jgi:hypothetical protein